jgi:hypothetical protein
MCFAESLFAPSLQGIEIFSTPSSYFASIFSLLISSGRVKLRLKDE